MTRNQRIFFVIAILLTIILSLGCGLGDFLPSFRADESPTATMTPAVTAGRPVPTATPVVAVSPQVTKAATAVPTQVVQSPPPALDDLSGNMNQVDSYRMDFTMKSEGVDKATGKPTTGSLILAQEMIKSKKMQFFSVSGAGFTSATLDTALEFYEIGETGYLVTAAQGAVPASCLSFSSENPTFDTDALISPGEILGKIKIGALIARGETVNGIKADRYQVTDTTLDLGKTTSKSGEIWLAQNGGFVVRYIGQAEGEFKLKTTVVGKLSWTYDFSKVNLLSTIPLPASCSSQQTGGDVPIPPNAAQKTVIGDMITFSSVDPVKTVADWYLKQAPTQGWAVKTISSMDALVTLELKKDTRTYTVMIAAGTGNKGSTIVITKTK